MSIPTRLPSAPGEWEAVAKNTRPLFDLPVLSSASKISFEQFLGLRVLWILRPQKPLNMYTTRSQWLADRAYDQAKQMLNTTLSHDIGWHNCLESLSQGNAAKLKDQVAFPKLNSFSLVRHYQLQIQNIQRDQTYTECTPKVSPMYHTRSTTRAQEPETPTRAPPSYGEDVQEVAGQFSSLDLSASRPKTPARSSSHPPLDEEPPSTGLSFVSPVSKEFAPFFPVAEDEELVNTALAAFLNALVIHFKEINAICSSHRKSFFCRNDLGMGFEARVDGYLRRTKNNDPMAILEVKPCIRSSHDSTIRMQEGAQMAAWINAYPQFHDRYRSRNGSR